MTLPGMALVLIAISLTPAAGRMLQSPAEDAILPRSSVSARHSRAAVETLDRELINRNGNVPEMEVSRNSKSTAFLFMVRISLYTTHRHDVHIRIHEVFKLSQSVTRNGRTRKECVTHGKKFAS